MFNVIVDTRERLPWALSSSQINEIIYRKLDTGDYSIEGMEDILCIERKKSVAEVSTNITSERFHKEVERMSKFKHAFLILEFDIDDVMIFPKGSKIPKNQWRKIRTKGPFIRKYLAEIMVKHNIHVLYCGDADNASYEAVSIMRRIKEIYPDG